MNNEKRNFQDMEVRILTYGMIRNPGCLEKLNKMSAVKKQMCRKQFEKVNEDYRDFLTFFLVQERISVKILIGLMELIKRKEEIGYESLIKILDAGYGSMRRIIKEMDLFEIQLMKGLAWDENPILCAAQLRISLLMAEDMEIAIEKDALYQLCEKLFAEVESMLSVNQKKMNRRMLLGISLTQDEKTWISSEGFGYGSEEYIRAAEELKLSKYIGMLEKHWMETQHMEIDFEKEILRDEIRKITREKELWEWRGQRKKRKYEKLQSQLLEEKRKNAKLEKNLNLAKAGRYRDVKK